MTARLGNRYRYNGAAVTSDFAWLFGAGFAPLVALYLSEQFGLAVVGVYLLSGAVCSLAACSSTGPSCDRCNRPRASARSCLPT